MIDLLELYASLTCPSGPLSKPGWDRLPKCSEGPLIGAAPVFPDWTCTNSYQDQCAPDHLWNRAALQGTNSRLGRFSGLSDLRLERKIRCVG
jgi:hypothetical protein